MLEKNPQKWFDKNYFKDKEEDIDIRKENIRNILGGRSNLHGSLKIEGFTKLISINLENLKLTGLEIINCPQLTRVELSKLTKLESLFVSKCPRLTKLDIFHSQLTELTDLDVSNLIELDCSNTSIKKLRLNLCPDIIRLNCSNNNKLINLDVSNCFKLKFLDCSQSKLTKLDLRNCPESIEVVKPPDCVITRKKEKIKNILIIGCTGSGKSTLANVLTGTEYFKESEYGVSKTKCFQKVDFEWEGTKYCAIDTIGVGNAKLSIKKVSNRIAEGVFSLPEGISQVILVVGKNFTDEINTLGLFESDIFEYTTIVRTKFSNFKNRDICEKDKEKQFEEIETNAKIVKSCNGIIYVDNPPIKILSYEDDDDDDDKETNIRINKKTREKSRTILLDHLKEVCQEEVFIHMDIDCFTDVTLTNEVNTWPAKVKEEQERNEIYEEKGRGKLKSKSIEELSVKPENKNKVESGVSQLQQDKKQNKLQLSNSDTENDYKTDDESTRADHFASLPSSPMTNNQQVIQQLKLTYGLFLNGYNIQPSKKAIVTEKGKLDMSLYNGQPIVYTYINDPASSVNLLNLNSDENNFSNTLQPSDLCINFPIAEVTYNSNLLEYLSKCSDDDETLYNLYGHFFARKTLVGGKLFIKELNLATLTQIDLFKFYINWAYNSAKYNVKNSLNDLPVSYYLPRIITLDGMLLDTPEKVSNWLNDLYQNHMFDIIAYKDLIPVAQLKNNPLSGENFEEKQPGVANFKEVLSLKEWVGNLIYINLVRWIKDFHFLQGMIITKFYKMEISKKIAASFIKLPTVKSSNKSYLKIIRPTKKVEEFLINNNINNISIKDVSSFPFINMIKPNDPIYGDHNLLVKFEQYEIHINRDCIKPSEGFNQSINKALEDMKPFKALQDVFDKYGHVFPQKIILGRSFKRNLTQISDIPNKIDLKSPVFESLTSYLNKLKISYLLTRRGNIIEKHELLDLVQNLNDDLEIIELDSIIPLYEILDKEQQEKIESIIAKYKQNNHKIVMTGMADLKDLDNNNTEHHKRINIQPSLEDENYEVIGSIISKQKNSKLEEFLLKFRLYDLNGFSAMIKTLKKPDIKIEECYIIWMIIGIPSKLSILSPRNQDLQVKYESVTLQPNQIKVKAPISLSREYIISVNAHHSYEHTNIKLVEWSESCIRFQINGSTYINSNIDDSNSFIMSDNDSDTQQELENNSSTNIETVVNSIDCHICVLRSDSKTFRIDNGDEEYPLDLIGYKLSEENFNEDLTFSDKICTVGISTEKVERIAIMNFAKKEDKVTSNKTMVFVEIVGDSTPTMKKLNLESNLSDIRKELKKNINDMNILLFATKIGHKFAKTEPDDENDTLLNDIIFENSGNKFLYLLKNSNPSWNYLNEKCKLDYGRITSFDGIKEANSKAFKMKDCEFKLIDSKGYKKGRLEFKSEDDWMKKTNLFFGIDINVQNFTRLGLSIGKSKDENFKDEVNSTYVYTEIGKASLKFNKENLELTSDFSNDVKNAIKSKDHNKFREIIDKYGQFFPTEVILGGRVYFKGVKSLSENSSNKSNEGSVNVPSIAKVGGNSSDSERKSDFYSFDHMKILGGIPPVDENFDEKVWNKSLEDYQTWNCIELKNPINIFKLLPDDIYKEAFKSIGKRILRTIVKDYDYRLDNPERYQIIELTDEESKIILNKDADCDIFATVVDDDENSKKVFFNCQILKNQNAKPSIIIHVIQKELQKRICKLKIRIMIIGYDIDFNFIHSNVSVELLSNTYNFNDRLIANNLFLGIPVLEYFNHLNDSITIGHNFRKLNNELIIEPFSYCSKKHSYHFSNLPQFAFYTIVIKNYSNIYGSHILEYPKKDEIKFSDKCPKYISMYFSEADSYLPVFMNQKSEKVYLKHICNKCEKCKQESEYNIKLKMYSLI